MGDATAAGAEASSAVAPKSVKNDVFGDFYSCFLQTLKNGWDINQYIHLFKRKYF
jgi:hypothetical protein